MYKPNADLFYTDMLVPEPKLVTVLHTFGRYPVSVSGNKSKIIMGFI